MNEIKNKVIKITKAEAEQNKVHPQFESIFENTDKNNVEIQKEMIDVILKKYSNIINKKNSGTNKKEVEKKLNSAKKKLEYTLKYKGKNKNKNDNKGEIYRKITLYGFEIKNGLLYLYFNNEKTSYYVINLEDKNDKGTYIENKNSNSKRIKVLEREIEEIFIAMDDILADREGTFGDYWKSLDNRNLVKYDFTDSYNEKEASAVLKYQGKHLNSLKEILDVKQRELFERKQAFEKTSISVKSFEKRVELLFGLHYDQEDAAGYFNLSNEEAKLEISNVLKGKSIKESLDYLEKNHKLIDENFYQSEQAVKPHYKQFITELNNQLFEKIKNNIDLNNKESNKKDLIRLIHLARGTETDIDDDLRDQNFVNKVLNYLMWDDKFSIKNKIINNIKIEDDEVGEKTPNQILNNCIDALNNIPGEIDPETGKNIKSGKDLLIQAGHGETLKILEKNPNLTYNDLEIEQKISISTLIRLNKKLKGKGKSWYEWYDKKFHKGKIQIDESTTEKSWYELWDKSWDSISGTKSEQIKTNYIDPKELKKKNYLGQLFLEVAQEGIEAVQDGINDNLDGFDLFSPMENKEGFLSKDADDFKLTGVDAEIFDLYQEVNGNEFWDISDNSFENVKIGGKIALALGAVLITGAVAMSIIGTNAIASGTLIAISEGNILIGSAASTAIEAGTATAITSSTITTGTAISIGSTLMSTSPIIAGKVGAIMGASGSVASIIISGKGYESGEDFIKDVGSDISWGAITGAIGGMATTKVITKFGNPNANILSKHGAINIGANTVDTVGLGMGTELFWRLPTITEGMNKRQLDKNKKNLLNPEDRNKGDFLQYIT